MKYTTARLIGISLITAGICLTASSQTNKTEKAGAATDSKKTKGPQTYYFFDWNDIDKGFVVPVYDPARLTEEAKAAFAARKKEWNIDTRLGVHGEHQYHMPHGIHITVEKARKSRPWLVADQPWELEIMGANVISENGLYRCWYEVTLPKQKVDVVYPEEGRGMEINGVATCYMESKDGMHWTKPNLGVLNYTGSKSNNIVSYLCLDTPFMDPHGPANERYKAFLFDELPAADVPKGAGPFNKYGIYGVVSPDGYHWTRLPEVLVRHFCDTWNNAGWDPILKKYVGYFRGHTGGRSITRAETDDYHKWPMPETLMCNSPEDSPSSDIYSCGYTTYPGMPTMRLMFPGIYHLDTSKVDVMLAISRDGHGWNWVQRKPIIENGKPGEWDAGMLFGQPNLFRLDNGTLVLPYSAFDHGHETDFAASYRNSPKPQSSVGWAMWDDGRLAGYEAETEGDFYAANPLVNISSIEVNARAAAGGSVAVEIVNKEEVLPGFSFDDCAPLTGDNMWKPIRFKNNELSELTGKKCQIHFRLVKAKVFGYRTISAAGKGK